ncbi:helix-turn-helix transcriptional regulator [Mesorhizobium marinum]|uniref:LuxR C-terminal-related transcriptional regulator n=1 Tax=Mesorhizobium marinum TaxID=3228790 RepID=A0ABV3QUB6_9HYPH
MTNAALAATEPDSLALRLASRGDLTAFLMDITAEIGADAYMLVAVTHEEDRNIARILASNWIHDAIELAGRRLIANLAEAPATAPGTRPRSILANESPDLPGLVDGEEAALLDVLGHREIYPLRLQVGRHRYFVLFSAERTDRIDLNALGGAQMRCCYALSQIPEMLRADVAQDPLSDRERECLLWVSEGKTTDEVALILGVSANTVNNYITHAIQKLSASNRAMAIATAIRSGII